MLECQLILSCMKFMFLLYSESLKLTQLMQFLLWSDQLLWTFSGRPALEPKQILKAYCSSFCFCKYRNPLEQGQVRIGWLKHKRVCMCVCAYNRYIHTTGLKLRSLQKTTLLPFFPRSFPPASLSRLSWALFFASLSSHLGFPSISPQTRIFLAHL